MFRETLLDLFENGNSSNIHSTDLSYDINVNDAINEINEWDIVQLDSDINVSEVAHKYGLSEDFVKLQNGGFRKAGNYTFKLRKTEEAGPTIGSNRVKSAKIDAISGKKSFLSPISGKFKETSFTIGSEWYFSKIEDDEAIFFTTLSEVSWFVELETIWVMPKRKLIIFISNGFSLDYNISDFAKTILACFSRRDKVLKYLLNEDKKTAICSFSCPHIAHNLWNMHSSWFNFLNDNPQINNISAFLEYNNQGMFGTLSELYPDLIPVEKIIKLDWAEQVIDIVLENNLNVIFLKDEYIAKGLIERIKKHANSKASPEVINEINRIKSKCFPLVLITIRLDNRCWEEQLEGWGKTILGLKEKYPNMAVIIDGLSSDSAMAWTTGWMSLEEELKVANRIISDIEGNGIEVMKSVGQKFIDSIVISNACDYFIAPSGSGMTIYKWISNLKGVAFSNTSVLDVSSPHRPPLVVWDEWREGIIPAHYIDVSKVKDTGSNREVISRSNFSMDWKDLLETTLHWMQEDGLVP